MSEIDQPFVLRPKPSLWALFSTWLVLGIQSFGGGSATFFLIHQTCIERGWLNEDEFLRAWSLAQISPGINLIKLTVLVGYHLRGWPGIIAAMTGLLLPSGGVTVLMTAGYAVIRGQAWVQAALKGILPATIGLSLAMGIQMAQPLITQARREGRARFGLQMAILAGSAALLVFTTISPVVVLLLAGAVTLVLLMIVPLPARPEPKGEAE